jgi:hypothetical protein
MSPTQRGLRLDNPDRPVALPDGTVRGLQKVK